MSFIHCNLFTSEFSGLAEALQELKLDVNRVPSNLAFNTLAELQGYDTIVLAKDRRDASHR